MRFWRLVGTRPRRIILAFQRAANCRSAIQVRRLTIQAFVLSSCLSRCTACIFDENENVAPDASPSIVLQCRDTLKSVSSDDDNHSYSSSTTFPLRFPQTYCGGVFGSAGGIYCRVGVLV